MISPDGAPRQPVWSCNPDREAAPPVPVPITLDNNTTYVPGIGHFDQNGMQVIGLPANHMRAVLYSLLSGDFSRQLTAGQQLDAKIERRTQE